MDKIITAFDLSGGYKRGVIEGGLFFQSPEEGVPISSIMESEGELIVPSNVYTFKENKDHGIQLQEKVQTAFIPYHLTKGEVLAERDYKYGIITAANYADFLQSGMSYSNYELITISNLLEWTDFQKNDLLMRLIPCLHLNLNNFTIFSHIVSAVKEGTISREEGLAAVKGYISLWM